MSNDTRTVFSTKDVAEIFGVKLWQVARCFEEGLIEERGRIGRQRAIFPNQFAKIKRALLKKGYLQEQPTQGANP